MSQQDTSKKSARAARAQRTRPTLVTSSDPVNVDTEVLEPGEAEIHTEGLTTTQDKTPAKRRFPGFFSSVGKSTEGEAKQEEGAVTQARMARAARTKVAAQVQSAKETEQPKAKAQAKPAAKPVATQARSAAPARPASPFKTRYIIGVAIYLIASNLLGMGEMYVLQTMKWERLLTTLDLFGAKIPISVSTLLFLATLVIILVALARFDLIPRTLGQPKTGTTAGKKSEPQRSSASAPKAAPPAAKQGVKGDHDHLYQEYQTQRRKKK